MKKNMDSHLDLLEAEGERSLICDKHRYLKRSMMQYYLKRKRTTTLCIDKCIKCNCYLKRQMQIFVEFEFSVSRFILHRCVFLFVPWDIFLSYQCTVNNKMVVCMKTLTSPFINGINNDSNTLFFIPNNSLLLVIKYVVRDSNPCRLNKLSRQKQFRRATLHELCEIITKSLKKMLLFSCC